MNNIQFKPVFIEGRDIDDTWYQLLQAVYEKGRTYIKTSGSRTGMKMYAFDFVSGFIHYPHTRPLAPRMPEGSNLPPPTSDDKIEKYFTDYLMNNKLSPKEHYKYSTWICNDTVNQLDWVINHFKIHGYGNEHCYIIIGNPVICLNYDKLYLKCPVCNGLFSRKINNICPYCDKELIINEALRPTTPCLRGLDFRIIDGYLTTNVIYRSWDMFAWPENMGGFTLLNEYVAEHLDGVKPGPLSFVSKSLHCPEDCIDILKMRIGKYENKNR